ncbi:MAG: hypothetical protein HQL51_05130 [Magnetococcales bacterium]|nr:hypothetical protein [Magnetococcales bacterium]
MNIEAWGGSGRWRTAAAALALAAALLLLSGCSVDSSELEVRNGKAYLKGSKEVYHGKAVTYHTDARGKKTEKIYEEGSYAYGLKDGVWITNKWDGGRQEIEYRLGKQDGKLVEYHRNGNKSHEQGYRNGVADGPGAYFDFEGELSRTVYYKNGSPAPELSQGAATKSTQDSVKKWVDSMNQGFLKGQSKEEVFGDDEKKKKEAEGR